MALKPPLIGIAQIGVPEPRLDYDSAVWQISIEEIEKAIQASHIGINPINDGNIFG